MLKSITVKKIKVVLALLKFHTTDFNQGCILIDIDDSAFINTLTQSHRGI